jgi:hypothetical protein
VNGRLGPSNPTQPNLKGVFWMKKVWLSNPTQDSGV